MTFRQMWERDQHARMVLWFALGGLGGGVELGIEQAAKGPWGAEATWRNLLGDVVAAVGAALHCPPPDSKLGRAEVLITDADGNPLHVPAADSVYGAMLDELGAVAAVHGADPDASKQTAFDAVFRMQGVVSRWLDTLSVQRVQDDLLHGDLDFRSRCLRAGVLLRLGTDTSDEVMRSAAMRLALIEVRNYQPALTTSMVFTVVAPLVWPYRDSRVARIAVLRDVLARLPESMVLSDNDDSAAVDTRNWPDDLSELDDSGGAP